DFPVKNREQPQRHQRVVKDCKNGSRSINPLEPESDIDQNAAERIESCEYRLTFEIVTDLRSNRCCAQNLELSLKSFVQCINDDAAAGTGVLFFRSLKFDQDVIATGKFLRLTVRRTIFSEQLPNLFNVRLFFEPNLDDRAALKIHSVLETALDHERNE